MSFKEFIKELNGSRVEGELIKTVFYSLLVSFALFAVLYFFKFRYISDFIPKYGFFLFFAILSFGLVVPTIRQVRAYKRMNCMSGMMVGMTIGMMAGFLSGYFVGATNGMFIGGVFGMTVGVTLGIWTGSCCGVMGFLEGIMAGFMGGLMGAMTALMIFSVIRQPAPTTLPRENQVISGRSPLPVPNTLNQPPPVPTLQPENS